MWGIPVSQFTPCKVHVIVTGITHTSEIPIIFHFWYTCIYCMKKNMYLLHDISLEFIGKSLQILMKLIIQILPKNVNWNSWNINTILHLELPVNTELIPCTVYICFSCKISVFNWKKYGDFRKCVFPVTKGSTLKCLCQCASSHFSNFLSNLLKVS